MNPAPPNPRKVVCQPKLRSIQITTGGARTDPIEGPLLKIPIPSAL
jgi:hypothetical protein